jgi:hypothetical protein
MWSSIIYVAPPIEGTVGVIWAVPPTHGGDWVTTQSITNTGQCGFDVSTVNTTYPVLFLGSFWRGLEFLAAYWST